MAVGHEGTAAVFQGQQRVVRHHGEGKQHLVDLRVAVAPDAQGRGGAFVQQPGHFLGVVLLRQGIPGAVVEQVDQEEEAVGLFCLEALQHLAAGVGRAVDVRCKQDFHIIPFLSVPE